MKKFYMAAVTGVLLASSSIVAADVGIGVKAGTLGYGAEFTLGLTDSINARVGLNSYSYSETATQDDIKYDMDMDWRTSGAFLDWHPMQGAFRFTLGYIMNSNEIAMEAEPASDYTVGDQTYSAAQAGTITGAVNFDDGLFYGIGWGNAGDGKGLGIIVELGILQQTPSVDLTSSGGLLSNDPTFQSNLKDEEDRAQEDMDEFDRYPVIAVGLSYSF